MSEAWRCSGCGEAPNEAGISTCGCATASLFREVDGRIEHSAKKRPCAWCGAHEFRAELDGEPLCQACCHKWVRGEGSEADSARLSATQRKE